MKRLLEILLVLPPIVIIPVALYGFISNASPVLRMSVFAVFAWDISLELVNFLHAIWEDRKPSVTLEDVKRLIEENNAALKRSGQA